MVFNNGVSGEKNRSFTFQPLRRCGRLGEVVVNQDFIVYTIIIIRVQSVETKTKSRDMPIGGPTKFYCDM